ncbi:cell division protein ZapA [Terriglobus sp. 2YAB30_2]|uniref:cell division protein ZapA n=2 Tax=unclassified Terriglobus TaxID=2628988 RepID=UPI003F9A6AE5
MAEIPQAVSVDIYGQIYNLRGTDTQYIERLAALVDAKMRAVASHGATVDSLRVAVLAALNIADELEQARGRYSELEGSVEETSTTVRNRADSLAGLLDSILEERRVS